MILLSQGCFVSRTTACCLFVVSHMICLPCLRFFFPYWIMYSTVLVLRSTVVNTLSKKKKRVQLWTRVIMKRGGGVTSFYVVQRSVLWLELSRSFVELCLKRAHFDKILPYLYSTQVSSEIDPFIFWTNFHPSSLECLSLTAKSSELGLIRASPGACRAETALLWSYSNRN